MTEERQLPNFEKYQYGALAVQMLGSETGARYAPSALELLAGSKGLNLGEESLGFVRGTQASEEGIQVASKEYAKQFQEKRSEYKPIELAGWYDSVLADLDQANKDKILGKLGEYDEQIKIVNKKVREASYITSDSAPEGLFSDEQISNAKKVIEKYQALIVILSTLDEYKFEQLRPDAVNTERKTKLKNLASKL